MATTSPQYQPQRTGGYDVKFRQIAAQVVIPDGTLAMNDAGASKPFTDTGFQGGASLLGMSEGTYDNLAINATTDMDQLYMRGCTMLVPEAKANDVPTTSEIGKAISMQDNNTCKKTVGNTDLQVVLLDIPPDGSGYLVRLP